VARGGNGEKFSKPFHQGDQDTLKKSHAVLGFDPTKLTNTREPQADFLRLHPKNPFHLGFYE
jgi:hypothetical protein